MYPQKIGPGQLRPGLVRYVVLTVRVSHPTTRDATLWRKLAFALNEGHSQPLVGLRQR
jgi:hypothetical protein